MPTPQENIFLNAAKVGNLALIRNYWNNSIINDINVTSDVDNKNPTSGHWTALHLAAIHGHERIVAFLIMSGANVDFLAGGDEKQSQPRETPLFAAAKAGRINTVRMLLSMGASINSGRTEPTITPLEMARLQRHMGVVEEIEYFQQNGVVRPFQWHVGHASAIAFLGYAFFHFSSEKADSFQILSLLLLTAAFYIIGRKAGIFVGRNFDLIDSVTRKGAEGLAEGLRKFGVFNVHVNAQAPVHAIANVVVNATGKVFDSCTIV